MRKNPNTFAQTRFYAGSLKGRTLRIPTGDDAVRPTRSAVLQASFDAVQSVLSFPGKHVLDICCGSGQWGLTALSLGAAHATLVDTDTATASHNVEALDLTESTTVLRHDATTLPPTVWQQANVVFADAPYRAAFLPKLLGQIANWLSEAPAEATERLAVVEVTPQVPLPEALKPFLHKEKTTGRSKVWILRNCL